MEGSEVLTNQPVVIDNGSGVLKAGFAGETVPKVSFPSYVGRPKHVRVMAGSVEGSEFVGAKAQALRGLLSVRYPIEHGVVSDWLDMEHVWQHAYSELGIESEQHPVLLTEAPLNPNRNREKAAEVFFETFNVPALFISLQAILSLYASGRTTGVVLDSGDGVTHVVPVYEGFAIQQGIQRMDLAGRDVTNHLQLLLRKAGYNFITSAEHEIVRDIKEKRCYLAYDPQKEEEMLLDKSSKAVYMSYKLPDGNTIEIGPERFRAPEILFDPTLVGQEMVGVHQQLNNSILKCDVDMRATLYSSIVLAGGSTMYGGFGDRLLKELGTLAPRNTKIKIFAPPERQFTTWIGGSLLAALSTFKKMWISHQEYEEEGVGAVHRKTFL